MKEIQKYYNGDINIIASVVLIAFTVSRTRRVNLESRKLEIEIDNMSKVVL